MVLGISDKSLLFKKVSLRMPDLLLKILVVLD
jgi:hypothetical protein